MPGRILIVDDLATNRIFLQARLSAAAYDIAQATNGAEALQAAAQRPPDLVILSSTLPDFGAAELCDRLRSAPGTGTVPIVVAGSGQDPRIRMSMLKAGADAVLGPRPGIDLFKARIRNLLHRQAAERELVRDDAPAFGFAEAPAPALAPPGQVALIAPDAAQGVLWKQSLAPLIRDRITLMGPGSALAEVNPSAPPDAFVIAGGSDAGLQLITDLRSRSETLRSAILLVADGADADRAVMALDLGISDLVDTGFEAAEMALRLRREMARKTRNDRTRAALKDGLRLAAIDPLTGLYNRRYAVRAMDLIIDGPDEPFAVMVLDLDRFKQVNDRYGHAAGDAVLTAVAQRMQTCLRREDVLARIGGEEFLAVIRNCDVAQAKRAAERLRRVVCDRQVVLPGDAGNVTVTLSVGLVMGGRADPAATLISRADRALYAAKADGRNQVAMARHAA
ncbi:MAG: diguanylate cyclase [Rhodobacter sp.]|nr:diguanylate cyclase [Rhodobacter sp.]